MRTLQSPRFACESVSRVRPMARAGSALYEAQPHYTGLAALDPHDANRVFVSSDVHPLTGAPLVSKRDGQ